MPLIRKLAMIAAACLAQCVHAAPDAVVTPSTFYEGPNDVHTLGRNASGTQPAKFLVLLLKSQNAPVFIAVK